MKATDDEIQKESDSMLATTNNYTLLASTEDEEHIYYCGFHAGFRCAEEKANEEIKSLKKRLDDRDTLDQAIEKMGKSQQDIPPDIAKIVNKHWWELF